MGASDILLTSLDVSMYSFEDNSYVIIGTIPYILYSTVGFI